ncbi:hypothetical protein Btru_052504 [Bulinus truncatus]|nr:hypothetical protein Btru_052504 [Bulinus truncatus]
MPVTLWLSGSSSYIMAQWVQRLHYGSVGLAADHGYSSVFTWNVSCVSGGPSLRLCISRVVFCATDASPIRRRLHGEQWHCPAPLPPSTNSTTPPPRPASAGEPGAVAPEAHRRHDAVLRGEGDVQHEAEVDPQPGSDDAADGSPAGELCNTTNQNAAFIGPTKPAMYKNWTDIRWLAIQRDTETKKLAIAELLPGTTVTVEEKVDVSLEIKSELEIEVVSSLSYAHSGSFKIPAA